MAEIVSLDAARTKREDAVMREVLEELVARLNSTVVVGQLLRHAAQIHRAHP